MSKINTIKQRLGRNSFDRAEMGHVGIRTQGERYRSRSLKADHKRDLSKQFGYPSVISLQQHWDMANHYAIAANLCYGIVGDCWRIVPVIYDGEEDAERRKDNPTEFEQAVDKYFGDLNIWEFLEDLDHEQRPMRYGSLMAITKEGQGVDASSELINLPTMDYLVGFRIFNELQLQVEMANQNYNSLDYGQPVTYNIRTNVAGSTNEWESTGQTVSASRVFSYGEGALGDSIYGIPALESSFEALMDGGKVRGSCAEGQYQNGSNKYAVHFDGNATEADASAIDAEMEDFDNEVSRSMMLQGGTLSMLQTTLSDPTPSWTIAINEACSAHFKPMKMVIGNQTGERASSEDITSWNRVIMDRQSRQCNRMIGKFISFLQDKFNFPAPTDKINIVWRDLNESTAEQKVDLSVKRAQANKACVESRMQPIYSTTYMQEEAGSPIEDVIILDDGGEEPVKEE